MTDETLAVKPLSNKHRAFVNEYLKCWNGTRAYMAVYGCNEKIARTTAARLLANVSIKSEIENRIAEKAMSADEALEILASHARGDMAEFMDITTVGFYLDLMTAKEKGITKLIKKIKQKSTTFMSKNENDEDRELVETEIELYDAQAAAKMILQMHGRFANALDITSGGEKINVILKVDDE
jgi:phage terminase small subunit